MRQEIITRFLSQFLENWLKKAGIPSIKEVWQKAKEEHRPWIFPTLLKAVDKTERE